MSGMTNGCWKPARRKYGVVVANYSSACVLHSLPLQFGETVQIWEEYWANEKTVTWLRGCSFNNKNKKGIFPAGYVQTKECTVENEGPSEVVTPLEDAIITEMTFVLREWHGRWKSLFVNRKSLFQTILLVMGELYKFRGTLVSNTLTKEHADDMKHQVVTMIDWGNGQLGMDLVPRVNYLQADPDNVSVVEMFRIHEQSVKNCQAAYPGGVLKVKDREKQGEAIHHLLVNLCSFACSVGDNSEVLLSLYDSKEGKFISEKFVMYFTRDGQREGNDKNNSTIFTDLNSDDIRKDLYLVVHILRKGRLTTETNFKKVANFQYRRPWGVSVLCLRELFQIDSELECFLRVQCVENESFWNMHENLIKKQEKLTGKSATNKQNQGVTLSLSFLHGDMKTVKVENPIWFTKGVILTQRMGFPDFINPGEIRNDLYLTIHGAELDRGTKTACKNVEVRVTVYNDHYELVEDCIFPASGDTMKPNFLSFVLYHNNCPKWNETIRLSIPIDKFSTAHIRLELCHCSNRDKAEKKMIGFAYLPVTTKENTTRLDGKYELCIYKCEDFTKVKNYLKFPSLRDDFTDPKVNASFANNIPYQHNNKECIVVETLLCSSKFAQKAELLNVLQWASHPNLAKTIPVSLDNMLRLKGQELVRYLQDILDALFNMFTAGEVRPVTFALNIFETLVYIFNLLHQQMFEKFSVVLEDYLEKGFSYPLAHKDIMDCLKTQADRIYTCTDFDEKSSKKVFKVLEDIFKFSVKSCVLSQRIYGGQSVKEFRENLNNIFGAFGKVVSSHEKELQKVQAQLLNHLHKVYTPLLIIISNADLAQLVVFILNKANPEQGLHVIKAKTNLIKNTINSQLFLDSASRSMLLPLILKHLKKCLIKQHHLELMANTLGDLLTTVYKLRETCDIKDEVTMIIQGVFDMTIRTLGTLPESRKKIAGIDNPKDDITNITRGVFYVTVKTPEMASDSKKKTTGSLLVACLTEMLRLMDVSHYQQLLSDFPKPKQLRVRLSYVVMPEKPVSASKEFLNRVLMVFRNLVKADDLPADWTTMRMITSSVMLTSIQYIAEDLTVNFLQGANFDRELWLNFFLLAVDFITQSALQLEKYSEAKGSQIKSKYQDMRIPVGRHICSLWNELGKNKQHLMFELIGPFLKGTMVPQLELRNITIPIFFDIMQCEFELNKHLRRVEGLMIQELDSLVLEHHGDVEYKMLFQSILMKKVQAIPELQAEGSKFIASITDLLQRLLHYREIMDREEQRDTKMHCTFNILNFYKDNRRDMYIRYICRLHELHYSASNFVEAGLTLRLYAELLSWSQAVHQADMSYPAQTEAARKEDLFSKIMDCFDKGKAWEYGIPLCKELADHYEKTFQYKNLGQILQMQASFLYQILEGNKLRQEPTYFRVAYFGNTFPPYLKNKAFIYRGDECLKLATIMHQLMTEYPSCTILPNNLPPDDSCKHADVQYIQIVSVKPVPSKRPEFEGKAVPSEISSFYNMNEVDTFQFDRPYYRGCKDENNEFKSLCLERTIMKTTYKLPGILRWYEVNSTQVVQLGPVQTATTTVKQMNEELKSGSENAVANPDNCLMHLEMRLQGVISGAVNGGIPKYQEAFFNKDYLAEFPDEALYIEELKSVILEQIQLLEHGLAIHGKLASVEMLPLHTILTGMFSKMKSSMGYQSVTLKHNINPVSERQGSDTISNLSENSSGRSSIFYDVNDEDDIYEVLDEYKVSHPHLAPHPIPSKKRSSSFQTTSLKNLAPTPGSNRPLSDNIPSNNHIQFLPPMGSPNLTNQSKAISPGLSNSPISDQSKPPPIPRRSDSQSSDSFNKHDRPQKPIFDGRSDSVSSTGPQGADMKAVAGDGIEQAAEAKPALPMKRPSITPTITAKGFMGSNSSINSITSSGSKDTSISSSRNVNTSDANAKNMTYSTPKAPPPVPAPPPDAPPPIVPKAVPNRESVHKPNTTSREPANQSPKTDTENEANPPKTLPSIKETAQLPGSLNSDRDAAAQLPSTLNSGGGTIAEASNNSNTSDRPPSLVPRSFIKREPPPLPSFTQSNMTTAMTPPRIVSTGGPPPIPTRKPSVTQ